MYFLSLFCVAWEILSLSYSISFFKKLASPNMVLAAAQSVLLDKRSQVLIMLFSLQCVLMIDYNQSSVT